MDSWMIWVGVVVVLLLAGGLGMVTIKLRRRGIDRWLWLYCRQTPRRQLPTSNEDIHLILCFADHFEPKHGNVSPAVSQARVERWRDDYPRLLGGFRDSDGRPPHHTFFYPLDEYEPEYVDALAQLCRAGLAEVEMHLHHDGDSGTQLRDRLLWFRDLLAERHGLLARDRQGNQLAYGFIHGNWALCNSHPDGRYCGVNEELDVLRETGCYADFTFPSPDATQPATINSLYYASTLPKRPRSHDRGVPVGAGPQPLGSLLLVQGPLILDWGDCKWGLVPHLENGCLQPGQPPSMRRVDNWLRARIRVSSRPDWFFVKLHMHGAVEEAHPILLGEPMVRFHEDLARRASAHSRFHYHYVTAREMFNLIKAAEADWQGDVAGALDYVLVSNVSLTKDKEQRTKNKGQNFFLPLLLFVLCPLLFVLCP